MFLRAAAAVAAIASLSLLPAGGAGAATIANGDFESGTLSGWQVFNSSTAGNWFAYAGTKTPFLIAEEAETPSPMRKPFFPPPGGRFAAVTDETQRDTAILYQDIALEPGLRHSLSLTLYYVSYAAIAVPDPNSLESDGAAPANQQLRVDLVNPVSPIDSVDPADVLAPVFANKVGDPTTMAPTVLTADLSAFAGQTVRLRIANAVESAVFNAGVDNVALSLPSNAFTRGKLNLNRKKGTGSLKVNVPGSGTLRAVVKGTPKVIKTATVTAGAAGTVSILLKPSGKGRGILKAKGKLKRPLDVTFTPSGGVAATQTFKVTLKKKPAPGKPHLLKRPR